MASFPLSRPRIKNWVLILPFLLIVTLLITNLRVAGESEGLQLAFLIDLLITIPLIHFFVIRKRKIPKITVIPLSLIGLFLAGQFLPVTDYWWFGWVKMLWTGLAEIAVLVFIILKIRSISDAYQSLNDGVKQTHEIIREAVNAVIPGLPGKLMAGEILTIFYAFNFSRRRTLNENEFRAYSSEAMPIFFLIFFLLITETFIFHILLSQWSSTAAWILTGISIYSGIQITGIIRSLGYIPSRILSDKVILNYGIFYSLEIPIENILTAEISDDSSSEDGFRMALLGKLEPVNMRIEFCKPVHVKRLYGRTLSIDRAYVYSLNPGKLIELMREKSVS